MRLEAVGKRYGMRPLAANWPGTGALLGAACLAAVAWGVSVTAATRRDTWSAGSS